MKEITYAFDLSELHELIAFLKLDPADLPEITSSEFWQYGTQELRVFYDFMEMKPPMNTRSEKLLCCPYDTLEIEFGGYKSYVNSQKTNFQEEFLKKEHSLRSKLSLKKAKNILQKILLRKSRLKLKE